MEDIHRKKLPDHSTLLVGREPSDDFGFESQTLQIWYNNTEAAWQDDKLHAHTQGDECFIVLKGQLVVELERGLRVVVGPREFVCFPKGTFHAVAEVRPPVETLMIRAPSVNDKEYKA